MADDFKSKMSGASNLPRVFLAKPKFYRGVAHPGNHPSQKVYKPWTMGAEFPEGAVRFTITPKGKGNVPVIEVKEETNWTPWIIGGLLGVGALALLASKTNARKKLKKLL